MARIYILSLVSLFLTVACNKGLVPGSPNTKDVEFAAPASEVQRALGVYKGPFGRLALRDDRTYTAEIKQDVDFMVGQTSNPSPRFYVFCSVLEFGRFDLFEKNGKKYVRFQADSVEVQLATITNRGEKPEDPKGICQRFAAAKITHPFVQQYEIAGPGALALRYWPTVSGPGLKFNGAPAHVSSMIDRPTPVGMFFTQENKSVDVTAFSGKFLRHAYTPKFVLEEEKFAKVDASYDPATGRFSYVNNLCGFAVDFKAKILSEENNFAIYPIDFVSQRDIDDEATQHFSEKKDEQKCKEARANLSQEKLKEQGVSLIVENWQAIQFKTENDTIEKRLDRRVMDE